MAGLSILTAQVFTTDDGAAADLFEVQGAFEPVVGEERWREFRHLLRKAIDGRVSLEHRMTEKRRHYPERGDTPVTVTVDNGASDFFTVIEVGAPVASDCWYDITRTLAEQGSTCTREGSPRTDRVIDAFTYGIPRPQTDDGADIHGRRCARARTVRSRNARVTTDRAAVSTSS